MKKETLQAIKRNKRVNAGQLKEAADQARELERAGVPMGSDSKFASPWSERSIRASETEVFTAKLRSSRE